jgi:hypothetical protein
MRKDSLESLIEIVAIQSEEDSIAREQADREAWHEELIKMSPEQLKEYLERQLGDSDVVVEGYGMASHLSEGAGISLLTIMKLRDAVETAIFWVSEHLPENAPTESNESDDDEL